MRPRRTGLPAGGSRRRDGLAAVLCVATLLLAGCAAHEAGPGAAPVAPTAANAAAGERAPSLPPGDPGPEAPAVPDPGVAERDGGGEEEPRREVPRAALLDPATVGAVLGGSWSQARRQPLPCTAVADAVAARTVELSSASGRLLQTVTTHADAGVADGAVTRLAERLVACGWEIQPDPRLGSASVAATDAGHVLTAVSVEGVGVVLTGAGPIAAQRDRWASVVDIALGSVCPAAPDGCH